MIDTPRQALQSYIGGIHGGEYSIRWEGSCSMQVRFSDEHRDVYYVHDIYILIHGDMPVGYSDWGWASKLMFNCSSKWLERYVGVGFETLEILKYLLGLSSYNDLLERFANWKLCEGFPELVEAAVDYYGLDYFKVDVCGRFLVYKINTKVEY